MNQQSNRRSFIKTVSAGTLGSALLYSSASNPAMAQTQPNIILFLIDDLGWIDVGCYGSEYYQTPNIDRLAAEGMRFTNGYAACAVCSPTRASILTGRYPSRMGITDWIRARFQGGEIPEDKENPSGYEGGPGQELLCPRNALWMEHSEITVAELLKEQGYTTCHIGKWHLGADDWYPDKQGFDYNIGGCDYGQPPSYFDPYCNNHQGCIPTLEPRQEGEYLTDREADEAEAFIRKHKEEPFFLYMANYAVHTPIQAKQDLIEKYQNREPEGGQDNATYAAMVESVDDCVGQIMDTLEELDLDDNTLIIFTSDNGGLQGPTDNAPLRSGKGYPYEGGIREPFIVRWPGKIEAGMVNDTPVCSIDCLPTICDAVGIEPPQDRPIDGKSLMPLLTQTGTLNRESLFWHFPHYRHGNSPYSIIRKGDYKLIKHYVGPRFELFNLKEDLSEQNNLAESEPDKREELHTDLQTWLTQSNAKLPKKNPNYEG